MAKKKKYVSDCTFAGLTLRCVSMTVVSYPTTVRGAKEQKKKVTLIPKKFWQEKYDGGE